MARKKAAPKVKKPKAYKSGYEKKVAAYLELKGKEFEYEAERLKYLIPESKHNYIPDFVLKENRIVIESKGLWDRTSRAKMALVIEQNPDRDIRMLFMRNNKINKAAKMTYGDWCDKRNIKWAVSLKGEVPEEWLNEEVKPKPKARRGRPKSLDAVGSGVPNDGDEP